MFKTIFVSLKTYLSGIITVNIGLTLNGYMISLLRPKQWIKNLFVFSALLFGGGLLDSSKLYEVFAVFVAFCAVSSAVYILNDIFDRDYDKLHPDKKDRPIASGKIKIKAALVVAICLAVLGVGVCFYLNQMTGLVVLAYLVLNFAYSVILKHIVIVDVIVVSLGFVLRVLAGGTVIHVSISPWLLICTILLALFMVLAKRRAELLSESENPSRTRKILSEYNKSFLDQMIGVVTASTVMLYALYTLSAETIQHNGTNKLVLTFPFVLYGIFRYQYLVFKREKGGNPTSIMFTDLSLIIDVILWFIAVTIILYFKP